MFCKKFGRDGVFGVVPISLLYGSFSTPEFRRPRRPLHGPWCVRANPSMAFWHILLYTLPGGLDTSKASVPALLLLVIHLLISYVTM